MARTGRGEKPTGRIVHIPVLTNAKAAQAGRRVPAS